MKALLVSLLGFAAWFNLTTAVELKMSRFTQVATNQSVSSYMAVTSARSSIECVKFCSRYFHCDLCAFDDVFGTCYLMPTITNSSSGGQGRSTVYMNTSPVCSESDAPALPSHITDSDPILTWLRTPTSLVGEVACNSDYMNSSILPIMRCLATGNWETENTDGSCNRRIYYHPEIRAAPYPVPLTPRPGWKVCLTGFPTLNDRFSFDFLDDANPTGIVLHMDNRLADGQTVVDSNANGVGWGVNVQTLSPTPLVVGTTFNVTFTATDMNSFQIDVNGALLALYTGTPRPIDRIVGLKLSGFVNVSLLDLWCE